MVNPKHNRSYQLVLSVMSCCLLVFSGCMREPQSRIISHKYAQKLDQPWRMHVIFVWDGLRHSRDPHVSHLIEVHVIRGPAEFHGQTLCLPYSAWSVGKPPPEVGSTLNLAPRDLVRPHRDSKGADRASESAFTTW